MPGPGYRPYAGKQAAQKSKQRLVARCLRACQRPSFADHAWLLRIVSRFGNVFATFWPAAVNLILAGTYMYVSYRVFVDKNVMYHSMFGR